VYLHRPSGCRVYPVIVGEEKSIILDAICKSRNTISAHEKKLKGRKVIRLLQIIDAEAHKRLNNYSLKQKNPTTLNKP
jgi:Fe-S-cluster containining protein